MNSRMPHNAVSNTSATTNNWSPTHDEIAAQAYQIYLREGGAEGRDMDHWLRAEAELRERATRNAAESKSNVENGRTTGAPQQETAAAEQSDPNSSNGPRSKRQN